MAPLVQFTPATPRNQRNPRRKHEYSFTTTSHSLQKNKNIKQDEVNTTQHSSLFTMKKLQFVKVKCECGYTNLIPAYENIKCEKCGKLLAEPKKALKDAISQFSVLWRCIESQPLTDLPLPEWSFWLVLFCQMLYSNFHKSSLMLPHHIWFFGE